jgi:carboxypeptidase D
VEVVIPGQCSGSPIAGFTTASDENVCLNEEIGFSLNGDDTYDGLSYQWQSSPDSITWIDFQNDTLGYTSHSQITNTYYRCAVNCNGNISYSIPVLVSMNPPDSCYCIGEYTTGCDALDKIIFNTLVNTGSGCNGMPNNYINYPDTGSATTTIYSDSTYTILIASGSGTGIHSAGLWCDFDHNGDFQGANEFFYISDSIQEFSGDISAMVTIPSNAMGTTRIRVRYIFNNPATQSSDCAIYSYGETEDYTVNIINVSVEIDKILSENINVYPVPASNNINISLGKLRGKCTIQLFDQMGRLIYYNQTESQVSQINTASYTRGIYFLKVEMMEGVISKKVIIE